MPSSELTHDPRWRGCLAIAAATLVVALALVAARVIWFDAYWLFRRDPPWLSATDGSNRLIDRQTRRAKILQAMRRDYSIALIGSSTVYHGLNPDDAAPSLRGEIFNVGISALMGDELPIVASVVASRASVRRIVMAVDYYMFSRRRAPVRLDADLADWSGRATSLMGSVISRYALFDSRLERVAGSDDPGAWTYQGFRITPPLPAVLTRENDATRRRTAAPYRPDTLSALDLALDRLKAFQVDLYLSPVSPAQQRLLADAGLSDDFARWRADVAALAARHGVGFHDLADLGLRYPFDPNQGSTDAWLDNIHYTPVIGRQVLEAVGLRSPGQTDAPKT